MRPLLNLTAVVLLSFGAAIALTIGAAAQAPTMVLGIPIPDRVEGLPHLAPEDFETRSPGMGYGIRFVRPDWTIDIYIYDLRLRSIPDDPTSPEVQKAVAEAEEEISDFEKNGQYSNVKINERFTVTDSAGRARFICERYNYLHNARGIVLDSYLCLAGVKNEFFNIRMDRPTNAASGVEVRRFVKAWIDVLWPTL